MQLTGKEILEKGIITGSCPDGLQQQGIDVRVKKITKFLPTSTGHIGLKSTALPKAQDKVEITPINGVFTLTPGYYELEMEEGCDMKDRYAMTLKTRSSLCRCGSEIVGGQFDAGFKTDSIGCFLRVEFPINIEVGARVAQTLVHESTPVINLYDGQWQNDKQRL